jgi:hypothetical protein
VAKSIKTPARVTYEMTISVTISVPADLDCLDAAGLVSDEIWNATSVEAGVTVHDVHLPDEAPREVDEEEFDILA